jgi:glycosyltransferase involved in cell wall biosynthesis
MRERVHVYVDSVHSIGGVTTWAFQIAAQLTGVDARVVTVTRSQGSAPDEQLFPGPRISIYSGLKSSNAPQQLMALGKDDVAGCAPSIPTKPTVPTTPTIPTVPTDPTAVQPVAGVGGKKPTKITKETKPTKPTLPTKPTILGHAVVNSWDDLSEFVRHQISMTSIFVPNYLEVGYRHAAISRVKGFPSRCIGVCHTDVDHYYDLLVKYERIIQTFVAVSNRCKRKLCDRIPHRENDIYFLPYGVDPAERRRVQSRGAIRLVYSGRLVKEQKRIMDLVRVVEALEAGKYKYRCDFIGAGRDKEELIEAVKGLRRVAILDGVSQPQMAEMYADYDVLVLASEAEGMSIAMLESMARGVVPVVTRVSGSEEVVIDGVNGFLCEVGDVKGMADRVRRLGSNRGLLAEMSKRAYESVATRYSTREHVRGLSDLVCATVGKPLVSAADALFCLRGRSDAAGADVATVRAQSA